MLARTPTHCSEFRNCTKVLHCYLPLYRKVGTFQKLSPSTFCGVHVVGYSLSNNRHSCDKRLFGCRHQWQSWEIYIIFPCLFFGLFFFISTSVEVVLTLYYVLNMQWIASQKCRFLNILTNIDNNIKNIIINFCCFTKLITWAFIGHQVTASIITILAPYSVF